MLRLNLIPWAPRFYFFSPKLSQKKKKKAITKWDYAHTPPATPGAPLLGGPADSRQGRRSEPVCRFTLTHTHIHEPKPIWALRQVLFWARQPQRGNGRSPWQCLGFLPAQLQAGGIAGVGAGERRELGDRTAGSRERILGEQALQEGGQDRSWGHGTCQAPGRASASRRAPLSPTAQHLHGQETSSLAVYQKIKYFLYK